ncbi:MULTISPECIES: YadA-like family protein [unclassified Bartonella]|uniref:YadA-like family protein n=1 Tax=unclassified Bartonella TaxID=2645622 RepID=UPI0035CF9A77
MKKIYTTPRTLAVSNLKKSCSPYRLPFIKTLSLVSVAVFLSGASPVSACDAWGNISQYFGAGTNVLKDIAPTYIINGKVYRDVGSALYGLEREVAGNNLVKQDSSGFITIGANARGNRISIENSSHELRTLTGVNNGVISPFSSDAVNGSQIFSLGLAISSYFGGGAGFDRVKWTPPTFKVKVFDKDGNGAEKSYHNVADAFTGVNSSFTNLDKKIENIVINSAGNNLVKQNSAGLITIGGNEAGNRIDIANSVNAPRILSGVRGGAFTATSTEAVNGGQLYFMAQAFASYFGGGAGYDDAGTWNDPTFIVKTFDKAGNEAEKSYKNVADAFAGVNRALTTLNLGIVEINNGLGIGETDVPPGDDYRKNITAGFPFMRSSPVAMNGEEDSTPITIASYSPLTQVSFLSSKGKTRRLFNISAGDISEQSTDAINGSQLYAMSNVVARYFGGGAEYKDGNWSAPNFTVKAFDMDGNETENIYTNVADALAGVNSALTTLNLGIIDINSRPGIVEVYYPPKNDDRKNITAGFPFTKSSRLIRSLPFVIDEAENAMDEEDNSTTVTVAPREMLEKSTYEVTDNQFSQMSNRVTEVESKVNSVTNRVTEVESKVNSVTNRVTEVENKVNVAVSYDTDDSGKKTNSITLKGVDDSEPVLITNVKDGEIKEDSKDAVNGGQLYKHTEEQMRITLESANKYTNDQVYEGVNAAKSYTDMKFDALSYDITNVRKEARQAAAIGLAVSNLRYFDDPGSVSVSFGGGFWRGQSAFAIGAGYTSEDGKIRSNLSATSAGGKWGVGGGITLKLK